MQGEVGRRRGCPHARSFAYRRDAASRLLVTPVLCLAVPACARCFLWMWAQGSRYFTPIFLTEKRP